MPIFVQWKWEERRKSFLVIFHFYDDFSKPNLRIKKYSPTLVSHEDEDTTNVFTEYSMIIAYTDLSKKGGAIIPKEAWMTWAPSHLELALLSDLLSYANMVNGLDPTEKRMLKNRLEAKIETTLPCGREAYNVHPDIVNRIGKDKKVAIYDGSLTRQQDLFICVELCPEYIDYLKEVLKPYISDS